MDDLINAYTDDFLDDQIESDGMSFAEVGFIIGEREFINDSVYL